ncbi:MAG: hypothetical protein NC401_16090, partial [Ruminococcus sp.]|nr:hypothetical protein [Ruminococcus sp.]
MMKKMHKTINREDFKICPKCGGSLELNIEASPIGDVSDDFTEQERWLCHLEGACECEAMIMLADYFPTAEKGIN